jgi:hypothetical protein
MKQNQKFDERFESETTNLRLLIGCNSWNEQNKDLTL